MFFKIREEGKQHVSPKIFWGCVALVVCLLTGLFGIPTVLMGSVPKMSPIVAEIILVGLWVLVLVQTACHGRRVLSWMPWTMLIGMTILLGGMAWPHSLLSASWAQLTASVIILAAILPQIFELRRKHNQSTVAS